MANFITIPNDNDPVINGERLRITSWAPTHSWIYAAYNDSADHIVQIERHSGGQQIDIVDCICHGSPVQFDHTTIGVAQTWGESLSLITGFSGDTVIYLDACNTGLTSAYGGPIAQTVANGTQCTVYGTKGYMTGTYAENNERCYDEINGLPPYPGAQSESGRNVWIAFYPQLQLTQAKMADIRSLNISVDNSRNADNKKETSLTFAIDNIINSSPVDFPNLRMAPDITLNYKRENDVLILDIYANGGLIKDRVSGLTWKVTNPDQFNGLVQMNI